MATNELAYELRKAWYEYGEAIKKAFRFPSDAAIVADSVEAALPGMTDERARGFIKYVQEQTEELRSMRFIDEQRPWTFKARLRWSISPMLLGVEILLHCFHDDL
jgi:hypothetical protein